MRRKCRCCKSGKPCLPCNIPLTDLVMTLTYRPFGSGYTSSSTATITIPLVYTPSAPSLDPAGFASPFAGETIWYSGPGSPGAAAHAYYIPPWNPGAPFQPHWFVLQCIAGGHVALTHYFYRQFVGDVVMISTWFMADAPGYSCDPFTFASTPVAGTNGNPDISAAVSPA